MYSRVLNLYGIHILILTLVTTTLVMVSHLLAETHVHALLIFPTHMAIQIERWSWRMHYMCKVSFGTHCIMPSHCTLNLLLIHHNIAPCLWNISHSTLNHASIGLFLKFLLSNTWKFVSTHSALQLAAEHTVEYTNRWKIRAQHSHIIQTNSGDQIFSFAIAIWVWIWP